MLLRLNHAELRFFHVDLLLTDRILRGRGIQFDQQVTLFHISPLRHDVNDARHALDLVANAHFVDRFQRAAFDDGDEKIAALNFIKSGGLRRRTGMPEQHRQQRNHRNSDAPGKKGPLFRPVDDGQEKKAQIHVQFLKNCSGGRIGSFVGGAFAATTPLGKKPAR